MLKSMTGYGRNEAVVGTKKITVEVKSVNHRFSDYNIKVPRQYGFLEERMRLLVSRSVARGKIDVYVSVEACGEADKIVTVNEELAENYIKALRGISEKFGLEDDVTTSVIASFSDIFRSEPKRDDEEELWEAVAGVANTAVAAFTAMREREGPRIEEDLRSRIKYSRSLAAAVDERSPQIVEEYREKLYNKINELLEGRDIDDARVLTEVALFADKVATNEEIVRLSSHYDEFDEIMDSGEPAGRRLDFLIQEINREVNTIGSKSSDLETAKIVVTLKGEIEKLREQIQNIE
ncbi:MAG: YicC family protein [Clostridia bacterium]|nr:YicC family protein [Clostridia bacterium]